MDRADRERDSKAILKRLKAGGVEIVPVSGSHHKLRKGKQTIIVPHPKKDLNRSGLKA